MKWLACRITRSDVDDQDGTERQAKTDVSQLPPGKFSYETSKTTIHCHQHGAEYLPGTTHPHKYHAETQQI